MGHTDEKISKKKQTKKFDIKNYKGYMIVLILLFTILFVLIGIAIGMIRDQYVMKEPTYSESKIESEVVETETIHETETTFIKSDHSVDEEDPLLILINRDHPVPKDLDYKLVQIEDEYYIDERVLADLQKMLSDAKDAGHELVVCSAWRSFELQETLYHNKMDEYLSYGYAYSEAREQAAFWVALPGTSEHEVGLAVDIVSEWYQHLTHDQADTAEQQWLMEHCHEYGFILRYPEDKQDITHIGYEPWHYRYVGKGAAKDIKASGLCLEEYLNAVEVQ